MKIDKILVSSLNQTSSLNSEIIQKQSSANETSQLTLQDVDEDAELIQKEACAISKILTQVDSDNEDELLRNNSGTTYVIAGNNSCGRCDGFARTSLSDVVTNMEGEANFLYVDTDSKLFDYELRQEADCHKALGLPAIVKCVDGKAVEIIDYNEIKDIIKDADKLTTFLEDKVEGEINNKTEKETTQIAEADNTIENTEADNENNDSSEINEKMLQELEAQKEQLEIQQKLASLKASIQSQFTQVMENISTDSLESAIESAISISDLKSAVTNNSLGLDFSTQMNLQNAVAKFDDDTDLDKAKESLLELI